MPYDVKAIVYPVFLGNFDIVFSWPSCHPVVTKHNNETDRHLIQKNCALTSYKNRTNSIICKLFEAKTVVKMCKNGEIAVIYRISFNINNHFDSRHKRIKSSVTTLYHIPRDSLFRRLTHCACFNVIRKNHHVPF